MSDTRTSDFQPLVEELKPAPEAEQVFRRLAHRPHALFLDSARRDPQLGRYSFVTADPFDFIRLAVEAPDALGRVSSAMGRLRARTVAGLPPFQGGAAGLLAYELGRQFERVPVARYDEFQVPALAVGLYDTVVAFDHLQDRAWLISQGFPETEPERRRERAHARLSELRGWLAEPIHDIPSPLAGEGSGERGSERRLAPRDLAPQFAVAAHEGVMSTFTCETYLDAVDRAIEYIRAGDIFQVNLSQRLLHPATDDAVSLYLRLRRCNPATFAGYFDLGDIQIASASPERFVRVFDAKVETRPIKGTRRRTASPEADLFAGDELRASAKDRAENVMIVDLLRNDLSRVCLADSVRVDELCRLETYQFVQHLVSVVTGRLKPGLGPIDLLRAAFPGGSITGAPKVRAMEIVAELEPTARGAYCGALAYLGFDGSFDSNILIRTITAARGWWQAPVGGGIVARSDPAAEYAETWHKAEGLLQAFG